VVEQKDKRISNLERKHVKEVARLTAAMQQQSDETAERSRRLREEMESELDRTNREWQRKIEDILWKHEQERKEWEQERQAWSTEREGLIIQLENWKKSNEELETELKVTHHFRRVIFLLNRKMK